MITLTKITNTSITQFYLFWTLNEKNNAVCLLWRKICFLSFVAVSIRITLPLLCLSLPVFLFKELNFCIAFHCVNRHYVFIHSIVVKYLVFYLWLLWVKLLSSLLYMSFSGWTYELNYPGNIIKSEITSWGAIDSVVLKLTHTFPKLF